MLPFLGFLGAVVDILSFEALGTRSRAEVATSGLSYSCLGVLASWSIGLVALLVCQPWRRD